MLSLIDRLYGLFVSLLTNWGLTHFIVFLTAFPLVALILQVTVFCSRRCYARGRIRLARFLKKNSYVTPRNLFFFNKKVVGVFPKNVKKQVRQIVDNGAEIENLPSVFKYGDCYSKPAVVKAGYVVHILSMGVIMSMNGFALPLIAFAAVFMSLVWIGVGVADMLLTLLIVRVDRHNKNKFIFALERNLATQSPQIDLSVPPMPDASDDSVSMLAQSVEDFLATEPDKGIAGVVLKSLYSASFSGAMSAESATRLKNVMLDLKNYVG